MKQLHLPKPLCRRAAHRSAKLPFDHNTNRIKSSPLHAQQIGPGVLNSYEVNVSPRKENSNQI